MGDDYNLRAGDDERAQVSSFLARAMEHGIISPDELGERIELATQAKNFAELLHVSSDIPGGSSLVRQLLSARVRAAKFGNELRPSQIQPVYANERPRRRSFWKIAGTFLVVVLALDVMGAMVRMVAMPIIFALMAAVIIVGFGLISKSRHHHHHHRGGNARG